MKITTLTPIHIGNGEALTPLSYVIHGNSLCVVNMEKFFDILSESQRESYLGWMDPILNKISELDKRIEQTRENRDPRKKLQDQKREAENQLSLTWFIENMLRHNPYDFARRCLDYHIAFVLPPGRDGLRLCIKDAGKGVYIPGTEIKGAVRTSLLYTLLEGKENYEILRRALNRLRSSPKEIPPFKKKSKELSKIADAQSESGIERRLLRGKEKDAKYDLLKFFNISDTNSVPHTQLRISTLIVLGSSRNIRIWLETINPRTEFHFNFNIQKKPFLNELGLEKLKDWVSLPRAFEACYHRSKEALEEEGRYFADEGNIAGLIGRLSKENQPSSPLLRIGFGQGFLGTTMALKVKQRDPNLYDEAIRGAVGSLRGWRTQPGKFPKTRRVTIDKNRNPESLLGWVKLSED
jgi:CRISPR-associated protein Csm5